ncbi:hypothetical protein B0J17DRAFT_324860 [Rhizoctonia solani]|nr:hypothetical protein B0J17DRAFT_324860 [Rhizoctonia solani]
MSAGHLQCSPILPSSQASSVMACYINIDLFEAKSTPLGQSAHSPSFNGLVSWLLTTTITILGSNHTEPMTDVPPNQSSRLVSLVCHRVYELTEINSDLVLTASSPVAYRLLPTWLTSSKGENQLYGPPSIFINKTAIRRYMHHRALRATAIALSLSLFSTNPCSFIVYSRALDTFRHVLPVRLQTRYLAYYTRNYYSTYALTIDG